MLPHALLPAAALGAGSQPSPVHLSVGQARLLPSLANVCSNFQAQNTMPFLWAVLLTSISHAAGSGAFMAPALGIWSASCLPQGLPGQAGVIVGTQGKSGPGVGTRLLGNPALPHP